MRWFFMKVLSVFLVIVFLTPVTHGVGSKPHALSVVSAKTNFRLKGQSAPAPIDGDGVRDDVRHSNLHQTHDPDSHANNFPFLLASHDEKLSTDTKNPPADDHVVEAVTRVLSFLTKFAIELTQRVLQFARMVYATFADSDNIVDHFVHALPSASWIGLGLVLTVAAFGSVASYYAFLVSLRRLSMPQSQPSRRLLLRINDDNTFWGRLARFSATLAAYLVGISLIYGMHCGLLGASALDRTTMMIGFYWALAAFVIKVCFDLLPRQSADAKKMSEVDSHVHGAVVLSGSARLSLRLLTLCLAGLVALLETALALGAPPALHEVIVRIVVGMGLVMAISLILFVKNHINLILENDMRKFPHRIQAFAGFARYLMKTWHRWLISGATILYCQWLLKFEEAFQSFLKSSLATLCIFATTRIARKIIIHWFHHVEERYKSPLRNALVEIDAGGMWHVSLRSVSYLDIFTQCALYAVSAFALLDAWHIGMANFVSEDSGQVLVGKVIVVGLIIFITLGLWELIDIYAHRFLLARQEKTESTNTLPARYRTLLLLLQNIIKGLLTVIALVLVMAECGINIGVIVAGFGIVGIALAMGSQRLIQDFVMGIFILLDRSLEIGSVVIAGGVAGKIQSFSIRAIRLASHDGLIHIVPYSQIEVITAFSDFTLTLIEVEVATEANLDVVMNLIRETAVVMRNDTRQSPRIISDATVFGVSALSESMMKITAEVISEPDPNKEVEREFRLRVHQKLCDHNIPMPRARQSVTFGNTEKTNGVLPILVTQTS